MADTPDRRRHDRQLHAAVLLWALGFLVLSLILFGVFDRLGTALDREHTVIRNQGRIIYNQRCILDALYAEADGDLAHLRRCTIHVTPLPEGND